MVHWQYQQHVENTVTVVSCHSAYPVILSEAKNLTRDGETLRFAQGDKAAGTAIVCMETGKV